MSNQYRLTVAGYGTFELNEAAAGAAEVIEEAAGGKLHVLDGEQRFQARIQSGGFPQKHYEVLVGNTTYEVQIADALDLQIEAMGYSLNSASSVSQIEAPMPGLILSLEVEAGDTVEEGQTLLVLEAMKMENAIRSPRDGKIKAVAVSAGMAVDKKALLLEFED
ncbi:Biotin-requiring enzyme [Robiginitalea myxolifaciens]|uniref:Biotin-requiring enzyme n=1 Tax=Robiginitalea myxolifaciens TaxID=400055 RepID=A0A1I6FNA0_9FLAO|nr:acetyl-CoA carboxylase biotin carboxyl carrier protein subunit [Robiginitalea myxolifaciens]SFR31400.1 Biotin-requiring enzyme [Robiginitalea myxolifaciens]